MSVIVVEGDPESVAFVPRFPEYSGPDMHSFTEPTPVPARTDISSVLVENGDRMLRYPSGRRTTPRGRWPSLRRHPNEASHCLTVPAESRATGSTPTPQSPSSGTRHGPTAPDRVHLTMRLVVDLQSEIVETRVLMELAVMRP